MISLNYFHSCTVADRIDLSIPFLDECLPTIDNHALAFLLLPFLLLPSSEDEEALWRNFKFLISRILYDKCSLLQSKF